MSFKTSMIFFYLSEQKELFIAESPSCLFSLHTTTVNDGSQAIISMQDFQWLKFLSRSHTKLWNGFRSLT